MKNLLIIVSALFVLVGCQKSGDEFVGGWRNDHFNDKTMEITKDGDSFIIDYNGGKVVGKLEGSHLNVATGMGGTIPVILLNNDKIEFTFLMCGSDCNKWTRVK